MDDQLKQLQNEMRQIADNLLQLTPEQFTLLSFSLGYLLATPLTIDQQNTLGNFIILFGQVFLTLNAQKTYVSNKDDEERKKL